MKEKQTYKRFDLLAILAIAGCIGMFIFEGIFIFERYDLLSVSGEAAEKPSTPPATVPEVNPPKPSVPVPVPPATNTVPVG